MADFKQILSDEIRRLAKKEVKLAVVPLHETIIALKKQISELNKRVKELENQPAAKEAQAKKQIISEKEGSIRLSRERIIKIRKRLGLSQIQFAEALGVNQFTVSHWELGKTSPRMAQKVKIATLRDMGKRERAAVFAEKAITPKVRKAKKTVKAAKTAKVKTVKTVKPAAPKAAAPKAAEPAKK